MIQSVKGFFCDRDGHVVMWQRPNIPLLLWAVATVLAKVLHGHAASVATWLAFGFIFTWAWLELRSGASPFRRTLGAIILFASVLGHA